MSDYDWRLSWHPEEELNLPPGVSYLVLLGEDGRRWAAPLGSPVPDGVVVEQVTTPE